MERRRNANLGQLAYESIKDKISARVFEPGSLLLQDELAATLGMSRTPVRDALTKLENDRLVRLIPNKGAVVIDVSLSDVYEIRELRMLVEGYVARVAATRATPADIAAIKEIVAKLEELASQHAYDEYLKTESLIHKRLLKLMHNKRLEELVVNLHDQSAACRLRAIAAELASIFDGIIRDHHELIEALEKGDSARAEAVMKRHIASFFEAILRSHFPSHSEALFGS